MGWITTLLSVGAKLVGWWTDRQAAKAAALHDAEVRQDQSNKDALQGESDAVRQVDKVGAALDVGGVSVANDPNNDNR
jgi:hypothetical protein